jgi:hypothetical protein
VNIRGSTRHRFFGAIGPRAATGRTNHAYWRALLITSDVSSVQRAQRHAARGDATRLTIVKDVEMVGEETGRTRSAGVEALLTSLGLDAGAQRSL